jgi:hypothetical protein
MVLPIIGGFIGREASRGDRERQRREEERAYRGYEDLRAPELREIEQRNLDRSMYTGMPDNFGGRDYEDEALAGMAEFARDGGLGAQGNLAMEQARLAGAAQGNRANAAIQANAARRGMGGAGSLVAQQVAQQGANATASLGGMQAAGAAENRRMGATQALGGMAGAAEGRRSAAAMERARQLDAVNQFEARLGLQTDMANRGYQQQSFQNQLGIADRQYGSRQRMADQYGQRAQDTAGMWYGIGQGAQDMGMALGQMYMGMPPTAAMGGGGAGGAFSGAQAGGSAGMQTSANGQPGPYRPAVQPDYFALPDWYNYPGY